MWEDIDLKTGRAITVQEEIDLVSGWADIVYAFLF